MNTTLLHGRTTPNKYSQHYGTNQRIVRTLSSTVIGNVYATYFTVPSGMVAVCHGINVIYNAPAGAGVFSVDMRIGGADEWHFRFPIEAGRADPQNIRWDTSELTFGPGATIEFKTDASLKASVLMQVTLISETDAAARRLRPFAGFTKGHGALGAGVRTVLVPAVAGKCIEVLGICASGHTVLNPGDILLEFSDGGANNHKFFRRYATNPIPYYGKPVTIGRQPMHCRGPKGYNLSVTADADMASVGSINVYGRYVDEHETFEPTGVPQGAGTYEGRSSRYFWFHSEDLLNDTLLFPNVGSVTIKNMLARVKGYAFSGEPGVGSAVNIAGGIVTAPLSETIVSTWATATLQYARDDLDLPVVTSTVNPVIGRSANAWTSLGVTVWGTLEHQNLGASYVSRIYSGA